jgi:hypothetical protein
MNTLLILEPSRRNSASKVIDHQGTKVKDYDAGMWFIPHTFSWESSEDFHEGVLALLRKPGVFMLLGQLTAFGKEQKLKGEKIRRLKNPRDDCPQPPLEGRDGRELVLDIDGAVVPDFDPFDPVLGVQWLLDQIGASDVTTTWQITSSQKLGFQPTARIRLYLLLSQPYSIEDRKQWAKRLPSDLCVDPSVFQAVQPIYTAPPTVEGGGTDPLPIRSGTLHGERETLGITIPTSSQVFASLGGQTYSALPGDRDPLELIGDSGLGRGVHAGIMCAIWLIVLRDGDAVSDQAIKDAVRARTLTPGVLSSDRSSVYVGSELSDQSLDRSITGARQMASHSGRVLIRGVPPLFPDKETSLERATERFSDAVKNVVHNGGRALIKTPIGFGKTQQLLIALQGSI